MIPLPDPEPQTPAPRPGSGVRDPLAGPEKPTSGPRPRLEPPDAEPCPRARIQTSVTPFPARGCSPRPGAQTSAPGGPPLLRPGCSPPPPIPARDPGVPADPPRPRRCGTSADDGQAGQGGGDEKPEPGPGRRGGHRGSGGAKGEGKGGAGPGRARPGEEGEGEGDPACGCTGPGGGGGGGRGLGGRDEAAGAAADPGRGAALTGRKADQSGDAGGRGGGAEGGLLVGGRGLCYCGPAPTPSRPGRPHVFPSRIPRTLGRGHFLSPPPFCFGSQYHPPSDPEVPVPSPLLP